MHVRSLISLLLLLPLVACERSSIRDAEPINEVAKISGLKFPSSAMVVFRESSDRDIKVHYTHRVIQSSESMTITYSPQLTLPADSTMVVLKSLLKQHDVGKAKNEAIFADWTNQHGTWRGTWLETTTGFYLYLENFN